MATKTVLGFKVRGEGTPDIEIDVYDVVGDSWWGGVSASGVRDALKASKTAKNILLRIHSSGGSVLEGLGIYNQLVAHPAKVTAQVDGIAASIASVIAMAAEEIVMAENSFMMIHDPSGWEMGGADEMRAMADLLDKMRDTIAGIYVKRTGQSTADVLAAMKAETWMTGTEAKALGYCTSVIPAKQMAASFDVSRFANVPASLMAMKPETPAVARAADADPPAPPPPQTPQASPPAPTSTQDEANDDTKREPARPAQETTTMSNGTDILTTVRALLGLSAGTPESDITSAVNRLRDLEREVLKETSSETTAEAIGAVRALKAKAAKVEKLEPELREIRAQRDKQNLETAIAKGSSPPIKLTPALVDLYRKEFSDASDLESKGQEGACASVVARLEGYLKAAPAVIAQMPRQPAGIAAHGGHDSGASLMWNGKTYAELKPAQRAALAKENDELFRLMKQAHDSRAA